MKALLLALIVVLWFAAPVVAAPDCPRTPTPTPPPTAVTLADVEGSGPWYVWLGTLIVVALVAFGAGIVVGETRASERGRTQRDIDRARRELRGEVR